jgi:hypothetical protein
MKVLECDIPSASSLDCALLKSAYYRDSYRGPLSNAHADIADVFIGIFGHHPWWMKTAIVFRNAIVSLFGLETSAASEIFRCPIDKRHYAVGEKIGPWSIYHLTQDELIVGRDNRHLDFRLSLLKANDAHEASVAVSTVCKTHNFFGKAYLFFVVPFHKWGVKKIMRTAVSHGRI